MLHLRRRTTAAVLALALGALGSPGVHADEPPSPQAPAPRPDQAAALVRAAMLSVQAMNLRGRGMYAEAIPIAREALAIHEKALGKDHSFVGASLNNLALLLQDQGALGEARTLCERALAIKERVLGKDHPRVATSLNNLALLFQAQGAYGEALLLLERALAINEKAHGKDHPDVALSLNNLAVLLQIQGDYGEALPLLERALAIQEQVLGNDHPGAAKTLNNLANLLHAQGASPQARPLYDRALAIKERALGKDHPDVATILNNLAVFLQDQGANAEARPLFERALAIREKAIGSDHPDVASTLNNLARLLQAQGAYGEARPLIERALAIQQRALGDDHPCVATSLNNLASVLQAQGAFGEARPLFERALAIQEQVLGKDHPGVATILNNLATLAQSQGAYGEARQLSERALAIQEQALGKDHPDVALSLNNLASVLRDQGAYGEAWPLVERGLELTEAYARTQLATLSTQQRLALLRSTRYRLDNSILLAPQVGRSGYAKVLRFRGLVARAEAAERILARRASGEELRMQEQLQGAQHLAARLANEMPPASKAEARATWQRRYVQATAERERLTLGLARLSEPLRGVLERLDLGLREVQAQIGPDAALVELLRVDDGYFGWIVRAEGEPVRIDVGAAEAIEAACSEFVGALASRGDDEASAAARAAAGAVLRALVWAPIEARLGDGVKRVVICPDAALAALPLAALPGRAPATYLLDDIALSYAMNAQDLVPWKAARPPGKGALLVGGVDYERASAVAGDQPRPERPAALAAADRAPRGSRFLPLSETRTEVEALATLGGQPTTLLLGAEATEERLRDAVRGKRLLHIATHGFAREDLLKGLYNREIKEAWTSAAMERQLAAGHDPMLLSGLALAGANPREGGSGDDGILTALEASYLDLDGVDLVTLSACETAKGTAESGEGVQGLVQAFQMAGARNVIASLWKVDDEATRLLMEGVYERLLRKESPLSPADALREASLELRDHKDADGKARFAAPRYWAAFVAYGR